ncbi:hypothetical protein ACLOJK_015752 [Asimina triloba]
MEPAAMEEAGAAAVRRRTPRRCPPCRRSPRPPPAVPPMATPADDDYHDAVNVAVEGKLAIVQNPPPTFQIRRGRKPTLITVATRGESSSPVINNFNSIPLRSRFIMQATIPINACCHPSPPERCQGALSPLVRPRCRRPCCPRSRCPLPDATASLARCQLPAIPHVGKVSVGVSRPQRTTTMPTSHAAAATVTAQLQCPIRVAYK